MKRAKFLLPAVLGAVVPAMLFGHGWIGVSSTSQLCVALFIGALGVGVGACSFWLLKDFIPAIANRNPLALAICGVISGALVTLGGYALGSSAWDAFRLRGDLEAYLWCVALCSLSAGVIAIPFACGLGQRRAMGRD